MKDCSEGHHKLPERHCVLCGQFVCAACGKVSKYGRFTNDYVCRLHRLYGQSWPQLLPKIDDRGREDRRP